MRLLLAVAASLLLPLAAAGGQPAGEARYIPSGMFTDERDADYYDRWLGNLLKAMEEPVLLDRPLPRALRRRFRMVVSINHGGVRAIRVDQRRAGGARVRAVELSGALPRRIRRQQVYDIDRDAVLELERALDLARLRRMPVLPVRRAREENEICFSGASVFFELVEEGNSQLVTQNGCDMGPRLYRLIETLQPLNAR